MAAKSFLEAIRSVKAKLEHGGVRLSELDGTELAAAKRLVDRGKIGICSLPGGDFLVFKK